MVTQVANIRAGSEPQLIWPQTLLSLHCTIFMRRSEVKLLSCVQLFATPWTVAYQSPLSMGLSRQEYWSGLHFLPQGTFLTQGSNTDLRHCRQMLSPSQPQWEYAINQGTIWTKKWWLKGNREGQKVPFIPWVWRKHSSVYDCQSEPLIHTSLGNHKETVIRTHLLECPKSLTVTTKCRWGRGETGILILCWWECKTVCPL